MVDPRTVGLHADDRVFVDPWDRSPSVDRAPHIQLTRWSDLFVVVPATADIMGKAASGVADDLLSIAILSYTGRIVFAPAMNPAMWENRAVRRNVRILEEDGHHAVSPETAVSVNSGEWDQGLAPSPASRRPMARARRPHPRWPAG
jgi:phosphopantothenoylcysteine decarboxylase/phosphopantothenate--cysteine ligase